MPYKDLEARRVYGRKYRAEHKDKIAEEKSEWQRKRRAQGTVCKHDAPEYVRDMSLRRMYGITLAEYNKLVTTQCGSCAICGVVPCEDPEAGRNQKCLHVDHDHETGEIRGLLCSDCNRGIGFLKEDSEMLMCAALYMTDGR